jgi:hypothetical protein
MRRLLVLLVVALLVMPSAAMAQDYGSREFPIRMDDSERVGDWQVSVVAFDSDAYEFLVSQSGSTIDRPATGNRYALIRIKAKYVGDEVGDLFWELTTKAVGESNVGYDYHDNCPSVPEANIDVPDVFPGGEVEYNECFEVTESDADSLVMYVEQTGESGMTFFAVQPQDGTPVAKP